MSVPTITGIDLGGTTDAPLLLVGPSLGTSATTLWGAAAGELSAHFRVVGWDLPGHGHGPRPSAAFTMAELAQGVLTLADELTGGARFHVAGDSVGGAVTLQLALDAPTRLLTAAVVCSGARIGTPEAWHERAATVRASGTGAVVVGSAQRWFAPGFLDREPARGAALLHAWQDADPESYALVCEALAGFDVTDRLPEIAVPLLAVAGEHDVPTPPSSLSTIVDGVQDGRLVVLDDVAHLAPAEAPHDVSRLLIDHAEGNLTHD
jgi:3-oxoadipate enol-lactonase/4-carboxymuconolactone decarboxylase